MDRGSVSLQVRQIVSDVTRWPLEKVTEDSTFDTDLKADSLEMVNVVTALEQDFGTSVSDTEFKACLTVGQLVDLAMAKLSL